MVPKVALNDICEEKVQMLSSQYSGEIEYIDISSINNERKTISSTQTIDAKEAPSRAKQLIQYGDILVSTVRPNLNAVALVEKESDHLLVASTGYCVLRCYDRIDKHYVFHFCQSPAFIEKLVSQATGASYPAVTTTIVKNCLIPLPSIAEQHKISAVLDKVSNLISLRKQQLDKLDELVKVRFVEMFGDLKSNPMKWPVESFPSFAKIDGNMTSDYEKYADYPHIGIDSIEKGTGALKGYRTVKEDGVISGKYIFSPRHIIYSKIRPNLNKVALPDFAGLCSADAYPILPTEGKCNRIFLATAMRSNYFLDYILQFSSRTNLPKVNRQEISGFSMPLPPLDLQEKFAESVKNIEKRKLTIQQSLDKLEVLKKTLMQEYFR